MTTLETTIAELTHSKTDFTVGDDGLIRVNGTLYINSMNALAFMYHIAHADQIVATNHDWNVLLLMIDLKTAGAIHINENTVFSALNLETAESVYIASGGALQATRLETVTQDITLEPESLLGTKRLEHVGGALILKHNDALRDAVVYAPHAYQASRIQQEDASPQRTINRIKPRDIRPA